MIQPLMCKPSRSKTREEAPGFCTVYSWLAPLGADARLASKRCECVKAIMPKLWRSHCAPPITDCKTIETATNSVCDRGLILDLLPPRKRDPKGIHNEIWQETAGVEYVLPLGKLLTFATHECGSAIRAYLRHAAVGDFLPDMPFLEVSKAVEVPLELSYSAAFSDVPRRWRRVLKAQTA